MNWYKLSKKKEKKEKKEDKNKDLYIGKMDTTQRPSTDPGDSNDQVTLH